MFWSIAHVLLLSQICLCRDGTIEESMRTKRVIAYLKDPKYNHKDFSSRYESKKVVETFHHIVKKILPPYNPNDTDYQEPDSKSSHLSRKVPLKSKRLNDFDRRKRREIDIPELFGFGVEDGGGGADVLSEFGGYSVKMLDKDDDVPKSSVSPADGMEPFEDVVDIILTDRPRLLQEWTEVKALQPEDLSFKRPSTEPFGTSDVKEGVLGDSQRNAILNRPSTKPFGTSSNKDEDLFNKRENLILIEPSTDLTKVKESQPKDLSLKRPSIEPFATLNIKKILGRNQQNTILIRPSPKPFGTSSNKDEDIFSKRENLILIEPFTEQIVTLDYKEDLNKQENIIFNRLPTETVGISDSREENLSYEQENRISNGLSPETTVSSDIREKDVVSITPDLIIFNSFSTTEPIGTQDYREDLSSKQEYGILDKLFKEPYNKDQNSKQEEFISNSLSTEAIETSSPGKEPISAQDCNSTEPMLILNDQKDQDESNDAPYSTTESLVTEPNACNLTRKRPKFMRKALRNSKHTPKTYIIQIEGESSPEQSVTSDMDLLRSILLANGSSPDLTLRRELSNKHVDDDSRVLLLWVLGSVVLLVVVVFSRKRSFLSKQ